MKNYITSELLIDGSPIEHYPSSMGHCMYNYLVGLLLSKKLDMKFVHKDLSNSSSRFNSLFNLNSVFPTVDQIEFQRVVKIPIIHEKANHLDVSNVNSLHNFDYDKICNSISENVDNNISTLFVIGDTTGNHLPGLMIVDSECIIEDLQKAYWSKNENNKTVYNNDFINVAIHIRRGDVITLVHPDRWRDNNYYCDLISQIKSKIPKSKFFVFTEGSKKDFPEFAKISNLTSEFYEFSLFGENQMFNQNYISDINVIVGGIDYEVFHQFVSSDILVTGQSSFSTIAAYFTKNKVVYTPCINFTRFENFNSDRFIRFDQINNRL